MSAQDCRLTCVLQALGVGRDTVRLVAVADVTDAVLVDVPAVAGAVVAAVALEERRLAGGISVRLQPDQDAQRRRDRDGQQAEVDEPSEAEKAHGDVMW